MRKEVSEKIRKLSGEFESRSKVSAFLYLLMRDELVCGEVERMVKIVENGDKFTFSNGWLARYSVYLASRLIKNKKKTT